MPVLIYHQVNIYQQQIHCIAFKGKQLLYYFLEKLPSWSILRFQASVCNALSLFVVSNATSNKDTVNVQGALQILDVFVNAYSKSMFKSTNPLQV